MASPADIGAIVAALPKNSRDLLLTAISPETFAAILRQMNPVVAARLSVRLGSRTLSAMLDQVRPNAALETLRRLPIPQARRVANSLEQSLPEHELLEQAPQTAGSHAMKQFPVVRAQDRVDAALQSLRELGDLRYKFTQVLVLDAEGELVGQVDMVNLALASHETPISDIVGPVLTTVSPNTPAAECARLRRHYNLTQLAVLEGGQVVGVIPTESLYSASVENETRQMLRPAGVDGEAFDGPIVSSIRTRLPWLTLNLATTFLAAAIIALFESTLARVVVLAAFLPVVAGQGGIGGTQTLTLIVRAIALGELVGVSARRLLLREAFLGTLHGVWLGLLVAAIAFLWQGSPALGLVLGLAMLGNMIIAGIMGAAVPLFLRRIGVDPAVASAIVVTTFTDVFGFLLFLGIATAALSLLV